MRTKKLLVNQECIVRDRPCNRVFDASNTCFIACPSSDEAALELDILKTILIEEELDPYVAIEHFEAAKDIFCAKICTKIIESKLCIVLLSGDTDANDLVMPNPNIYYEYGLMTAWGKPTIPIQKHDQKLAFNIQSLDTIKYSERDFKTKIAYAIRLTLERIEKLGEKDNDFQTRNVVSFYMELIGNALMKDQWVVEGTGFSAFQNFHFATLVVDSSEKDRLRYEARMIIRRLERLLESRERAKQEIEERMKTLVKENKILKLMGEKMRIEGQVAACKKPTFTLALADKSLREGIADLSFGDTVLKPEIMLITLEEIKKWIDKPC